MSRLSNGTTLMQIQSGRMIPLMLSERVFYQPCLLIQWMKWFPINHNIKIYFYTNLQSAVVFFSGNSYFCWVHTAIILDLCIPEKELAKTHSQISFIYFQSHSWYSVRNYIIPKGIMKTRLEPSLLRMSSWIVLNITPWIWTQAPASQTYILSLDHQS